MARLKVCVILALLVLRFSGCGPGAGGDSEGAAAGTAPGAGGAAETAGAAVPGAAVAIPDEGLAGGAEVALGDGLSITVPGVVVARALAGAPERLAAVVTLAYAQNRFRPLFLDPHYDIGPTVRYLRFLAAAHELGVDPFAHGLKQLLARTEGRCRVDFAGQDDGIPELDEKIARWVKPVPSSHLTLECDAEWWPQDKSLPAFDAALARSYFGLVLALSGPLEPTVPWDGPESAVSVLVASLPEGERYFARVAALRRFLPRWSTGSLPVLDKGGKLKEGDVGPRVGKLKARLVAEGFLDEGMAQEGGKVFDAATREAVVAWRQVYGLVESGTVDRPMLDILSWDAQQYVEQLWVSLHATLEAGTERGAAYVLVNIPEYTTYFVAGGRTSDEYRSVVGFPYEEPGGRTPVLSSVIRYVDLNPEWVPTPYVVENELQRKEKKEPGYLERNRFVYREGKLVQLPGRSNTLGQVLIGFPNENNVSLHGSPELKPFTYADRALSHGCVRVEDIDHLAARILHKAGAKLDPALDEVLDRTVEKRVDLAPGIPIYVIYDRVRVAEGGRIGITPDPYKLTPTLRKAAPLDPLFTLVSLARKNHRIANR